MNTLRKNLFFMDIGSRGGFQWPWSHISDEITTIMVEPDPIEATNLREKFKNNRNVILIDTPLYSSKTNLHLNILDSPGASSIFRPNYDFLNQFPEVERFNISKVLNFNCETIDNLHNQKIINCVDFVKIDVQGAELQILKGGKNTLKSNLIGLEVEVEFCELYKNQPLFSDLDHFIRNELGLELWDISKTYWKYSIKDLNIGAKKGRLIFGDALYFRPLNSLNSWLDSFDPVKKKSKIMALVESSVLYGYIDYATAICEDIEIYKILNDDEKDYLNKLISKNSSSFTYNFWWSNKIYLLLMYLINIFKPTHNNWASRGESELGSRKFANKFWR